MDPNSFSLVTTLLIIITAAVAGGFLAYALKIPTLLGYIAMGVVAGNVLSGYLDTQFLPIISDIGVTLLLFTLGLEMSFHRLKRSMGAILWVAFLQIVLNASIVFLLLFGVVGMPVPSACIIAFAASLSSTAVSMKILFEKGELDTMPGEILTSWLVIQDLSVVPMMVLLPSVIGIYASGTATVVGAGFTVVIQLLKAAIALILVLFFGKTGVPYLLNRVARLGSREVYLMTSVGIVFMASLCAYVFGLSAGLGAFLAGLMIAETSQNHMVFSEIRPLRDIFTTVFFVTLGMSIQLRSLGPILPTFFLLLGMFLLVKFVIVYVLGRFMQFHPKTVWVIGLGLLPMSEFGFILAREGLTRNAFSEGDYTLLILCIIGTIAVASPLFLSAQKSYYGLKHRFGTGFLTLGLRTQKRTEYQEELPFEHHVVICGYGRMGKYIGRALEMEHIPFVVIDYNHATIAHLRGKGITAVYGDPADRDVLDKGQVDKAKVVIIAIPDRHSQELIIGHALTLNTSVRILCRTHHEEDQMVLKSLGVESVIQPEFEAALSAVRKLLPDYGIDPEEASGKISRLKIEHGVG